MAQEESVPPTNTAKRPRRPSKRKQEQQEQGEDVEQESNANSAVNTGSARKRQKQAAAEQKSDAQQEGATRITTSPRTPARSKGVHFLSAESASGTGPLLQQAVQPHRSGPTVSLRMKFDPRSSNQTSSLTAGPSNPPIHTPSPSQIVPPPQRTCPPRAVPSSPVTISTAQPADNPRVLDDLSQIEGRKRSSQSLPTDGALPRPVHDAPTSTVPGPVLASDTPPQSGGSSANPDSLTTSGQAQRPDGAEQPAGIWRQAVQNISDKVWDSFRSTHSALIGDVSTMVDSVHTTYMRAAELGEREYNATIESCRGELQRAQDELKAQADEVARCRQALQDTKDGAERFRAEEEARRLRDIAVLRKEVEKLEGDLLGVRKGVEKLDGDLVAVRAENRALQQENHDLRKGRRDDLERVSKLQADVAWLQFEHAGEGVQQAAPATQ
ncbi:hypothetical protein PsYK624_166050 [Phanerochaete sordida]|uniref:Uncharacterized protein n=1 Tax=Phanerochaete sordida TaxID=48140 RepID=A0A9P3GTE6_9APHY|nr:hypothetical protein PsYK624_166050 [Phanerochaete sordida]